MKVATIIFNCKRCKVGKRLAYRVERQRDGWGRSYPSYWRETDRGFFNVETGYLAPQEVTPREDCKCPGCGRDMVWSPLEATRDDGVRCDSRCTNARGHSCNCSCGGQNHGAAWMGGTTFFHSEAA